MNQKEVRELKRRFRPDKNAISRIYGCFVDPNRRIISYLDESLGLMPEDDSEGGSISNSDSSARTSFFI